MPITNFQEALPMPEKDRAMLPIIDIKDDSKVVLAALPKGSEVPPHIAPYPASVQLLQGSIEALKGETWIPVAPGERVIFEQGQLHGMKALEASYFLVTHMRAQAKK
jgi:quercetin dioxygenase-like cupin family protein